MEVIQRDMLLPGIAYRFSDACPWKYPSSYIWARMQNMDGGVGDGRHEEKPLPDLCPHIPAQHRPDFDRERPAALYKYGKPLGDILWHYDLFLIKEEWVPRFEAEAFTGFDFRPVVLYKRSNSKELLPGFVEMYISGRVPIDEERSGVELKYRCPLCGVTYYSPWKEDKGLHFKGDSENWPDLFTIEQGLTYYRFASPRFARFVVETRLHNVQLVRIEDLLTPEQEVQLTFTKSRLASAAGDAAS